MLAWINCKIPVTHDMITNASIDWLLTNTPQPTSLNEKSFCKTENLENLLFFR